MHAGQERSVRRGCGLAASAAPVVMSTLFHPTTKHSVDFVLFRPLSVPVSMSFVCVCLSLSVCISFVCLSVCVCLLARDAQAKLALIVAQILSICLSVCLSVRDSLSAALHVASHIDYRLFCLSVRLSVCVCPPVCLSVCLSVCVFVSLCLCMNDMHNVPVFISSRSVDSFIQVFGFSLLSVVLDIACCFTMRNVDSD